MKAADFATKAADLVGGDRERQHGAKRDNFERIADMWNAWMRVRKDWGDNLTAHDVGIMMALLKIARTQSGAMNMDDYVDCIGYMACAGEIATDPDTRAEDVWDLIGKVEKASMKVENSIRRDGSIWYEDTDPLGR